MYWYHVILSGRDIYMIMMMYTWRWQTSQVHCVIVLLRFSVCLGCKLQYLRYHELRKWGAHTCIFLLHWPVVDIFWFRWTMLVNPVCTGLFHSFQVWIGYVTNCVAHVAHHVTVPFFVFLLKIKLQCSRCWKNINWYWYVHVPHNIISLMKRYRQVHISFAVCRIVVTWPVYFCFRQIPSEQLSIYFKWCKCSNHGHWVASRFVTSQTHFTTVSSTHLS